jgi:formate-dependent nitrite reductase membrane component NrfD
MRTPDTISEKRLEQLREQATLGRVDAKGIRPSGSPMPETPSYYGLPIVKPPVWTWEVPLYFFAGGAAGASSVIAIAAQLTGSSPSLVRDARWIAAIGAAASGPLLILDLGRPERFLNMLRVFKPQSAMSVGAWTLTVFGTTTAGAVIAEMLGMKRIGDASAFAAALSGLVMATYTGVLLGVTAIPIWKDHAGFLPVHFGASALGSAVSLLELRGHRTAPLRALGLAAATFESAVLENHSPMLRIAGALSGPVPFLLRLFGKRKAAAAVTLAGSLMTRIGWVEAGKKNAASHA